MTVWLYRRLATVKGGQVGPLDLLFTFFRQKDQFPPESTANQYPILSIRRQLAFYRRHALPACVSRASTGSLIRAHK